MGALASGYLVFLSGEVAVSILVALLCGLVWRLRPAAMLRAHGLLKRLTGRAWLCVLISAALPIAGRLALSSIAPQRYPVTHDEYVHLLVADTIAHGRLANPSHLLGEHFETIYVLQHPSYAAIYPIGQGAVFALGQLITGKPLAGHILSLGLMAGAVCWMLYGWVSPEWALAGGILTGLVYGVAGEWATTYLGGPAAAFGGALVFGAFPRFAKTGRARDAAIMVAGWSAVWLIRPAESLPIAAAIGLELWRRFGSARGKKLLGLAPAGIVVLATAGITLLHNWRVTGSPLLLPYQLEQREQGVPQGFLGMRIVPPPHFRFSDIREMYDMQLGMRESLASWPDFLRETRNRLSEIWRFFVNYHFSLPIAIALWISWCKPPYRRLAILCAAGFALSSLYPFFFTRYFAPYLGVFVLFVVVGLRALSGWAPRGRALGALLAITLASFAACKSLRDVERWLEQGRRPYQQPTPRHAVERQLDAIPGRHLVLVHYGPHHSFYQEWIYNGADIDGSKIVWARDLGPEKNRDLLRYFASRSIWYVNADDSAPVRAAPAQLAQPPPDPPSIN
ncbi:MAG TPA: hypothetical protein VH639_02525 [Bryobacteraceae bacterium]|jgi:hypothetical protein